MNTRVSRLPVEVDVAVPIRNFRVRDLLTLMKGTVIASQWIQGDDMPLAAPGAQLAWTEFEVIDQRLAVRITRLV
jgi:flagellar motor switch protein FliN/FliY